MKDRRLRDVGGEGLQAIAKVPLVRLRAPKLDLPGKPADKKDAIEATTAGMKVVSDGVANGLTYLAVVKKDLAQYTGADSDADQARVATQAYAPEIAKVEEYLAAVLKNEETFYRFAAARAYLNTVLSVTYTSQEEAQAVLRDLETREILVRVEKQDPKQQQDQEKMTMSIGWNQFRVARQFGFGIDDVAKISSVVNAFSRALKNFVGQTRRQSAQDAIAAATISLADALAGKNGIALLDIASQWDSKKMKWHGGGQLLAEFTNDEVIPLKGIGAIEKLVAGLVKSSFKDHDTDVEVRNRNGELVPLKLRRNTLERNVPPGGRKVIDGVKYNLELDEGAANDYVFMMRIFWSLIYRAIKLHKSRIQMAAKATIKPVEFFGLNGTGVPKPGVAFLEYPGNFRLGDSNFLYYLFLLVSQAGEETKRTIKLLELPEHLVPARERSDDGKEQGDTLGSMVGKEFLAGKNFAECPAMLRRILRAMLTDADKALPFDQGASSDSGTPTDDATPADTDHDPQKIGEGGQGPAETAGTAGATEGK